MLYRLFLILLALNVATIFAKAQAGEVDRHLDAITIAQIGADNSNSVPAAVDTGDCVRRVIGMIGSEWLKDLIGIEHAATQRQGRTSVTEVLRESEYDLRVSEEDILLNLTYRF